jgi:hypothetical protein
MAEPSSVSGNGGVAGKDFLLGVVVLFYESGMGRKCDFRHSV